MDSLSSNASANLIKSEHIVRQRWRLVLFGFFLTGFVVLKLVYSGLLGPRQPLDLNDQPALIFFTLSRGCECQMVVVEAAESQMASWQAPTSAGIQVLTVDLVRRAGLAQVYHVARAPALVLVDAAGEVIWKQDIGLSDKAPLDLAAAEAHIRMVGNGNEHAD